MGNQDGEHRLSCRNQLVGKISESSSKDYVRKSSIFVYPSCHSLHITLESTATVLAAELECLVHFTKHMHMLNHDTMMMYLCM